MSENKKMCFCEGWGLETDDTLYAVSSDDASIIYTPIYGIKFCPLCGNKLPTVASEEQV